MSRTGGKGRVSNELVAASCAAVLTVYAAGYWRTRDAASQLEAQAQERRQPRPRPAAVPSPAPAPELVESPQLAMAVPEAEPEVAPPEAEPEPAAIEEPPPEKKPVKMAAVSPKPEAPKAEAAKPAQPEKPAEVYSVPLEEPPPAAPDTAPAPGELPPGFQGWRDGTYTGWGTSYHGDIEAKVVIEGGRIVDSGVVTCATRYPCDVIYDIIFQPVQRQSPEVDRVSRATESADAYYYALVQALEKAEAAAAAPVAAPSP